MEAVVFASRRSASSSTRIGISIRTVISAVCRARPGRLHGRDSVTCANNPRFAVPL